MMVGTWWSCGCSSYKLSNVKRAGSLPAAIFVPVNASTEINS